MLLHAKEMHYGEKIAPICNLIKKCSIKYASVLLHMIKTSNNTPRYAKCLQASIMPRVVISSFVQPIQLQILCLSQLLLCQSHPPVLLCASLFMSLFQRLTFPTCLPATFSVFSTVPVSPYSWCSSLLLCLNHSLHANSKCVWSTDPLGTPLI